MSPRGVLIGLCVLEFAGAGCATSREGAQSAEAAAAASQAQQCSELIAADAPLATDYGPRTHPRTWWPTLSASESSSGPTHPVAEAFRKELALAEGPVEVLGLAEHSTSANTGGAALVLARPAGTGYCVINTWSTWLPYPVQASLAGSWVSPDKRMAILLLEMDVDPSVSNEGSRWTVLGTDGHRAWIALGEPPADQLISPLAALTPKNGQLYLDVQLKHVKRLRLGADGHFSEGSGH